MNKISMQNDPRNIILSENEVENLGNGSNSAAAQSESGEILSEPSLRALQSLASSRMSDLNLSAQLLQSSLRDYAGNLSSEKSATLFGGKWGSTIGGVDFHTQGDMGSANVSGTLYYGARGRVFGDVDWDKGSANFGIEGQAGVSAHIEGDFSTPSQAPVGIDGAFEGEAFAGAKGKGDVEVSLNGNSPSISAEGEVFAGARAGIEGEITPSLGGAESPVGAKYGAEGMVGLGASGNLDIGFKDGKFRFNITGGLALGLGGKASLGFELDYGKLLKLQTDFINKLSVAAKDVEKTLFQGLNSAGKGLSKVTTGITKGLSKAGKGASKTISKAANGTVETVKNGAKKAYKTGKKILHKLGIG